MLDIDPGTGIVNTGISTLLKVGTSYRDGVVMMVLVEMMVWMMMRIPIKPSLMMVLIATVSPLREGIPPAEICLPERSFSLCVFRLPEAAEVYLWSLPWC